MPITAKRLLDVLRSAAVDLDEVSPDTSAACWEIIETLADEGAETSYFPDALIVVIQTPTTN